RRIRDRAIHFPKLRDDLPGIATINDDSITLVEGFQARHDSPPRSPGKYTTGNSTRQELDSVNLALSCDQERERHEQCLMKKEDGDIELHAKGHEVANLHHQVGGRPDRGGADKRRTFDHVVGEKFSGKKERNPPYPFPAVIPRIGLVSLSDGEKLVPDQIGGDPG